ncbi:MAG: glutamate--tRNA ligase [Bacteroidetes bacterium]|nr:glutamate--tRNA ligase [Bacteroidota bacterium]MBU1720495.1 glutamate--tRNA ligase [Bacteroidota bacterium]
MGEKVRVRFAPSPTGPLHIGGVRTALYNYLFAKRHGGDFILRIEDTDQNRFVEGAEKYIVESLKWCGIMPAESPESGGKYGPYRQSERKEMYRQYADQLIKSGNAYYAFDTPEALEALRKKMEEEKAPNTSYCASNRLTMDNSLVFGIEEAEKRVAAGENFVIRFKMPDNNQVEADDLIRGRVTVNTALLDDKVLFKSDGMPTYHLANVVDDHTMDISHVIRGEEWLPSLPLHVMLYKAFGWEMPQFAHLPLLLKPDGKGKLSKRDGDKMGFPVFPVEWHNPDGEVYSGYRESGYLPQAFINMIALLGWNPGTEQEIFSREELSELFSIDRVNKAGARFDPEKAKWFNHQYIMSQGLDDVTEAFMIELQKHNISVLREFAAKVCDLTRERVNFVHEIWQQSAFFFVAPAGYDQEVIKKRWKENTPELLRGVIENVMQKTRFDAFLLKPALEDYCNNNQIGMGPIMIGLRLCMVGAASGPDLFAIMEMLGKEEVIQRIETGLQKIK